MACINPDGTLTMIAASVLGTLGARGPMVAADLARESGVPLYRVRATIRETGRALLIAPADGGAAETADGTTVWQLTDLGQEALELGAEDA